MRFLLFGEYIFLVLTLAINGVAESATNPMHSVKRCDPMPDRLYEEPQLVCQRYCQKTYIEVDSNTLLANDDIAKFYVERPGSPEARCCCLFNTPWPDFVNVEVIGRKYDVRGRARQMGDCLPLLVTLNMSHRTKDSYNSLCRYLNKKKRLNILEMLDFAEAAAYLNMMKPKHPMIVKTLQLKSVQKVTMDTFEQLNKVFDPNLLVTALTYQDFEGYRLGTSRLRRLVSTRETISDALRSLVIADAFDELVTSYCLVDIAAASIKLSQLRKEHKLPQNLLDGDYDAYNSDTRDEYFRLEGVDCKSLKDTKTKLSNYLAVVRATLSILREKLVYEHMSEDFKPLQTLIYMEKVYRNIVDVSCVSAPKPTKTKYI